MLIDIDLEQRIKEVFTEFKVFYPACKNYREALLGLTLNHMVLKLMNMPEERLENYLLGQQLKVDITLVLTQTAILLQIPKDKRERESVFEIGPSPYNYHLKKTQKYVTYNQAGGIAALKTANFSRLIYF